MDVDEPFSESSLKMGLLEPIIDIDLDY